MNLFLLTNFFKIKSLARVIFNINVIASYFEIVSPTFFAGEVSRYISYNPESLMFLPQKAYLTDGSLRQQVIDNR